MGWFESSGSDASDDVEPALAAKNIASDGYAQPPQESLGAGVWSPLIEKSTPLLLTVDLSVAKTASRFFWPLIGRARRRTLFGDQQVRKRVYQC
jgi:hypothetical protein